mgnify:CR=1 FL=1|jgi:hypothetical protein
MSISMYMEGRCHAMAVALHRRFGASFLLLCENAGDYHDPRTEQDVATVHHVYADFQNGNLVDIRGIHDRDDIRNQWEAMNDEGDGETYHIVELETEEELAAYVGNGWELPLEPYDDEDIDRALRDFTAQHPDFDPALPTRQR